MNQWDAVWIDINVMTFSENIAEPYGLIEDAAIAVKGEHIAWIGAVNALPEFDPISTPVFRGEGAYVTPGFIDCHTHLVFAGSRADEFERRLQGVSYAQIAEEGGGIRSTVKATREASKEHLFVQAKDRLNTLMAEGVSTVEIKSGYGLRFEYEQKQLEVAQMLDEHHPVDIQKTFLGAHAVPPEFEGDPDGYIDEVCQEMLPKLHQAGLVDTVDAFCESIGFSCAQTERLFKRAKALKIPVKLHAEQLTNLGGTELAASYSALSVDHIEYLDEAGVKAIAESGTVAVLLPGAFYYLRETQLPPIDLLRKYKVPMAIATDMNPGSSPLCSLLLMLNMGCTLFKLTPEEVLRGVTVNSAKALGMNDRGVLEAGKLADFAVWNIDHPATLAYQYGENRLKTLWKRGQQVV
ncbi:imidazolonepropionase [Algicola sagamiensis]|uniref:imidazolonepropionase n=1 Tax=Algicola sagamiensis TaxID=163869 RepID=UPI00036E8A55|nr:imidazolonepropionase [Algicola sagamiensis]